MVSACPELPSASTAGVCDGQDALALSGVGENATRDAQRSSLLAVAAASLALFVWWEGQAARPIIRIEMFGDLGFTVVNLVTALMYLATFSVLLFVPYSFARFPTMPLPMAGAVLAIRSATMAPAAPAAGRLVARVAAQWVDALGLLAVGGGLFLIGLGYLCPDNALRPK
jgi:hypothetical protein